MFWSSCKNGKRGSKISSNWETSDNSDKLKISGFKSTSFVIVLNAEMYGRDTLPKESPKLS